MSAGVPARPLRAWEMFRARRSGAMAGPKNFGVLDVAGGDHVDRDPVRAQLLCQGEVPGLHRDVGRRVGAGAAAMRGDRAEVDHRAARVEARPQRGGDQDGGEQVGVQVGPPGGGQGDL